MQTLKLSIIALAATILTGCGFGATNDEALTTAPASATTAASATTSSTASTPITPRLSTAVTTASAMPQDNVQALGAYIDASSFLNALVESGCQIDKAEYKEVKRGGAIKIVCSKTVDALNVELDDL